MTSEATDSTTATLIDIEGVRRWEWNDYKGDFFVGGRHAEFETDSQLLNFGVFTTGNLVNLLLQNGCAFDGNGVTYGGTSVTRFTASTWWDSRRCGARPYTVIAIRLAEQMAP